MSKENPDQPKPEAFDDVVSPALYHLATPRHEKEFVALQARIERLEAENNLLRGEVVCETKDIDPLLRLKSQLAAANKDVEGLKDALEQIGNLETNCCPRCEGNGRLWSDGQSHLPSHQGNTILCGRCGGTGRILPDDAQDIASEALKENE